MTATAAPSPLLFQILDIDYREKKSAHDGRERLIVYIFGTQENGTSVAVRLLYRPFLFVEITDSWRRSDIEELIGALSKKCRIPAASITFEESQKRRIFGWQPNPKDGGVTTASMRILRLDFPSYKLVRIASSVLRAGEGISVPGVGYGLHLQSYEGGSVNAVQKFIISAGIEVSGWLSIARYISVPTEKRQTWQTIEIETTVENLVVHTSDSLAAFKIASVDIECFSKRRKFPKAENEDDPVITIGCCWKSFGQRECFYKMFQLKDAVVRKPAVTNLDVQCFDSECDLLCAWSKWFNEVLNPDFITGHNINGFDWKYMSDRVSQYYGHCEEQFFQFSRLRSEQTKLASRELNTKAFGERQFYELPMSGRVVIDMLSYVSREYKLPNYKLEFLARNFGLTLKGDLDKQIMFNYFDTGTPDERGEIVNYCALDCLVVMEMLDKLEVLPKLIKMSSVTYTTLNNLMKKAQQEKAFNLILKFGSKAGYVINYERPRRSPDDQVVDEKKKKRSKEEADAEAAYQGATVIEPECGFYKVPIATLDFASMYPYAMVSMNLCCSTWVQNEDILKNLSPKVQLNRIVVDEATGRSHTFVKHIPGVLPEIERYLLSKRKQVKLQMKKFDKKSFAYSLLNAEQLALKITANSVYGFTGATLGRLPCRAVAESITAESRKRIDTTKFTVENKIQDRKTTVIYGDTDSIFVDYHLPPTLDGMRDCFRLGREAAEYVTNLFDHQAELEMEKVYFPLLLLKKKRYGGLKYEKPEDRPGVDNKGLEIVRRETCAFVKDTLEEMLHTLLHTQNRATTFNVLVRRLDELISGKIPKEKFVQSMSLRSSYENPEAMTQYVVAQKIRERGDEAPAAGDRVEYVLILTVKEAKRCEMAEDVKYAFAHNLPLNLVYYVSNQLRKPASKLLQFFPECNTNRLFDRAEALLKRICDKRLIEIDPKLSAITDFLNVVPGVRAEQKTKESALASFYFESEAQLDQKAKSNDGAGSLKQTTLFAAKPTPSTSKRTKTKHSKPVGGLKAFISSSHS